jgi:hypothetical protein
VGLDADTIGDGMQAPELQREVGTYNTFIVRIWAPEDESHVRGHIQHVRTRKSAYFATHGRMLALMDELSQPAADE